jgi:hypothetical protein
VKNPQQYQFRAFDIVVQSNVVFPELRDCSGRPVDIRFELLSDRREESEADFFHHWYADIETGVISSSIARERDGFRLRFPELADFLIDPRCERVDCLPLESTSMETIRHLFLDQVLPRLLGHRGNLILHASAVEVADRAGIAFVGESGWGKSTLASSFKGENVRFVTDDCLKFKLADGNLTGVSAYHGSRMWEDSIEALYPDGVATSSVSHYSNKRRILAKEQESVDKTVFNSVFFLVDPKAVQRDKVVIEPLQGSAVIMELIRRSFLLDVKNVPSVAGQFEVIKDLMAVKPLFYSLQYPRDYADLQQVRQAIVAVIGLGETG